MFAFEASYFLAAWAHLACALSDPGAVPRGAAEVLATEPEAEFRSELWKQKSPESRYLATVIVGLETKVAT